MGWFSEDISCAINPPLHQPMSIKKFIRELFSFKVLFICSFRLDCSAKGQKQLHLDVKPYKNGACCPECGRRGKLIASSTLQPRRWRDISCAGRVVWLHYRPREILCPTHGRSQELIPWAAARSRFSFRFEYVMLRLCSMMPQARVADILKVPPSTLADVLHRVVERYRQGHQIQGVTKIGIDEISYKKADSAAFRGIGSRRGGRARLLSEVTVVSCIYQCNAAASLESFEFENPYKTSIQ